jgi:hypothetical protein
MARESDTVNIDVRERTKERESGAILVKFLALEQLELNPVPSGYSFGRESTRHQIAVAGPLSER